MTSYWEEVHLDCILKDVQDVLKHKVLKIEYSRIARKLTFLPPERNTVNSLLKNLM